MVPSSFPAMSSAKLLRPGVAALLVSALFAAPAFSQQIAAVKVASVKVAPAALRLLEIAPVQAPQSNQWLWSPARLEYPSGQLDSVASPAAARITAIHVQPGQAV